MIKINFANQKQGGYLTKSGAGGTDLKGLSKTIDLEAIRELPLQKLVLPLIVFFGADYASNYFQQEQLSILDQQIEALKAEQSPLKAEANKLKSYEELRKSLEEDERVIRDKIDTIQKLVAGRSAPPRALIAFSTTLPENVWLSEIKTEGQVVVVKGLATDFNLISDFMKNMGENVQFSDLELKNTQQARDSGHGVVSFELSGRLR